MVENPDPHGWQDGLDLVEIGSLPELMDRLTQGFERKPLFRGLGRSSYKLLPTVCRMDMLPLKFKEAVAFKTFKEKAVQFLSEKPQNDLEWYFLARHHGLPTLIMDWSENPLVALYFAIESNHEDDCAVCQITYDADYLLNTSEKFPFPSVQQSIRKGATLFIRPPYLHPRYVNQASVFSIQNQIQKYSGQKIIIPGLLKPEIKSYLEKLNITRSFLYHDLDSLAQDIVDEQRHTSRVYITL